jgi:glycyl-tRNA synthetase beta chain
VRDFVLEIGAENIPASYVEPAFEQLANDAQALLGELRLGWEELYATGTPRRLLLLVQGLEERQASAEETVTGPPVSKGFDESGQPTKAAEGFARSNGIAVGDLLRIPTPKGEYLGYHRKLECKTAAELLAARLPALIGGLRFPKVMKWEPTGTKFARPVRWIVCLIGGAVVRFRFADVTSGNVSYGRPWFKGERVTVRSAESYLKDISKLGIIVDDEARRKRIWSLAEKTAARANLVPLDDPDLLSELTFMVEDPRVLMGEFPESYLRLPPEVVTTAMRSHQRYIALHDGGGRLVPGFITFTDGPVQAPSGVRNGNEKVLKARLEDARFYWQEDLKRGVEGLADELKRIVFIERLGTLGQKSDRIRVLARYVNEHVGEARQQPTALIDRAATLAKADLASEMIKDGKEFTLLQGRIGSHYARECGEAPAVVDAIEQHYWPRTPTDGVPTSAVGAAVGVADRIDTIVGCFLAGFVPTGSQDPYALRRQANGLVRILEAERAIRIDELIRVSAGLYAEAGLTASEKSRGTISDIEKFFVARCESYLKDRGITYDVVDAVSRVHWARPGVALEIAREIAKLRGDARFERLITGVKRVGNILSAEKRTYGSDWESIRAAFAGPEETRSAPESTRFLTDRFEQPAEDALYKAVISVLPDMMSLDRDGEYGAILETLSRLADPIDVYFDDVLVNCEDAELRENRHRFLAAIFSVFSRYADYSFIVEEGSE